MRMLQNAVTKNSPLGSNKKLRRNEFLRKKIKSLITRREELQLSFRQMVNICILIDLLSLLLLPLLPCLSRSLTLLDWTFLLQKQFRTIICDAVPQCGMQMLLALAALAPAINRQNADAGGPSVRRKSRLQIMWLLSHYVLESIH